MQVHTQKNVGPQSKYTSQPPSATTTATTTHKRSIRLPQKTNMAAYRSACGFMHQEQSDSQGSLTKRHTTPIAGKHCCKDQAIHRSWSLVPQTLILSCELLQPPLFFLFLTCVKQTHTCNPGKPSYFPESSSESIYFSFH